MKYKARIHEVDFRVEDDVLRIGGWLFSREAGPEVIAFIQQWLDHDPDEELRSRIASLAMVYPQEADKIIAAVREHDAKYRRKE